MRRLAAILILHVACAASPHDAAHSAIRVEHEVRQTETWIRTPAGWRLRKVTDIDLANRKRWIDGVLEKPPS